MTLPLVLASTSPYRRELLGRLGLTYTTCSPETDETRHDGEAPKDLVLRLSEAKARARAAQGKPALVIGSDLVPFKVVFRTLSAQQIENYVRREQPLN